MLKSTGGQLSDLENELAYLKPVSRDENELDNQLDEIKVKSCSDHCKSF